MSSSQKHKTLHVFGFFALIIFCMAGLTTKGVAKDATVQSRNIQLTYVPAYSNVLFGNRARSIEVAIMLTIRNIDPTRPLTVYSVRYYNEKGELALTLLEEVKNIAPLATENFFLHEANTKGGTSPSFLVSWSGGSPNPPLIQANMVGTSGGLGISIVNDGILLKDVHPDAL